MNWVLSVAMIVYLGLAAVPATWFWYDPGAPQFADVKSGKTPSVRFPRRIIRQSMTSYSAIVRGGPEFATVCEGHSNAFDYIPNTRRVIERDLYWWTSDQRCLRLPVGIFEVDTCWTVHRPLGDLLPGSWRRKPEGGFTSIYLAVSWWLPPKSVCRAGTFSIRPG